MWDDEPDLSLITEGQFDIIKLFILGLPRKRISMPSPFKNFSKCVARQTSDGHIMLCKCSQNDFVTSDVSYPACDY